MLVSLDTNVLAYADGLDDPIRQRMAVDAMARLPAGRTVVAAQVLGELFNVLTRKGIPRSTARVRILEISGTYPVLDTTTATLSQAVTLASDHSLSIWDAIILSASASAGCSMLLSEDMQHGFAWHGVTVVNPFLEAPHPLLRRALSSR